MTEEQLNKARAVWAKLRMARDQHEAAKNKAQAEMVALERVCAGVKPGDLVIADRGKHRGRVVIVREVKTWVWEAESLGRKPQVSASPMTKKGDWALTSVWLGTDWEKVDGQGAGVAA